MRFPGLPPRTQGDGVVWPDVGGACQGEPRATGGGKHGRNRGQVAPWEDMLPAVLQASQLELAFCQSF